MPGGLGDTRFNMFVLEHIWQWASGRAPSLVSPQVFYPYPYVLAFSDTHAGTAWAFVLARFSGADMYLAFKIWFALGYLGSFLAAYHVLRTLQPSRVFALAGAFVFAFSLPSMAQIGHPQLAWRVAIPYCFFFALRFGRFGRPTSALGFLFACSIQILINVYLGLFALILCGIVYCAAVATTRTQRIRCLKSDWRRLSLMLRYPTPAQGLLIAATAVAVACMATVMGFHAYVSMLYGFARSWSETATMVPRPQSYLIMDRLPYWRPISTWLPEVPVRSEHEIFLGIPTTLLVLCALGWALVWAPRCAPGCTLARPRDLFANSRILANAALVTFALFTGIGSVSAFFVLASLPGFDALRAVARYMIVFSFPLLLLIGLLLQEIQNRVNLRALTSAVGLVLFLWHAADVRLVQKSNYASEDSRTQIRALIAQAGPPDRRELLVVARAPHIFYIRDIGAMLAAQQIGQPLYNGYSGNWPHSAYFELSKSYECEKIADGLRAYGVWAQRHRFPSLEQGIDRIQVLGLPGCSIELADIRRRPALVDMKN